jgi:bifunctional non-homologous end joining protein LigD
MTRNGNDWTERYSAVAEGLKKLDLQDAIVDGELVAFDRYGRSHFGTLQNVATSADIELRYYAFDLLHLDGKDLRKKALTHRKQLLRLLFDRSRGPLRYSDHIQGSGDRVVAKACAMGMEGIVSKRADAPYRSGRGTSWIKSKCTGNDEFVVIGYRRSDKKGRPFASLVLGEYADNQLTYRGRVGTGFDDRAFRHLAARMKPLERPKSPLARTPAAAERGAVWLKPELVAQISYTERTSGGLLRHPSFLGLRDDKPAKEVTGAKSGEAGTKTIGGVQVTHPDRIMYPKQGVTKAAIAEYYLKNADRILPFLKGRPLSLVRCPAGRGDECFFQKHHTASMPGELGKTSIKEKDGKESAYLVIRNARGLVAAAQIGALELHIWGARTDDIEKPERLVFDLDPDPSVHFNEVRNAAFELRDVLNAAGLTSFALLTGGKGVHVIVPLVRRRGWPEIKSFAKALAEKLSAAAPDRYLALASKARRKGRIFIDWLRNERGATAVAPYSLRARPGAPVATPVSWEELRNISRSDVYSLGNIEARLAALKKDPWPGYQKLRQSLSNSIMNHISP